MYCKLYVQYILYIMYVLKENFSRNLKDKSKDGLFDETP